jgi:hypothetical protein
MSEQHRDAQLLNEVSDLLQKNTQNVLEQLKDSIKDHK